MRYLVHNHFEYREECVPYHECDDFEEAKYYCKQLTKLKKTDSFIIDIEYPKHYNPLGAYAGEVYLERGLL